MVPIPIYDTAELLFSQPIPTANPAGITNSQSWRPKQPIRQPLFSAAPSFSGGGVARVHRQIRPNASGDRDTTFGAAISPLFHPIPLMDEEDRNPRELFFVQRKTARGPPLLFHSPDSPSDSHFRWALVLRRPPLISSGLFSYAMLYEKIEWKREKLRKLEDSEKTRT